MERFWSKVNKTQGCWEWTACVDKTGYGVFHTSDGTIGAHRYSYLLHKGEIPSSTRVIQVCRNPRCVNPDHLYAATKEGRFWSKVQKTDTCWEWTANRLQGGYGQFRMGRSTFLAHRISYEMAYGSIPKGLHVLHRCDNPRCVRPDHLFLGTDRDNTDDKIAKGRDKHFCKLTDVQREFIRNSSEKAPYLAKLFNVHQATIRDVRRRKPTNAP